MDQDLDTIQALMGALTGFSYPGQGAIPNVTPLYRPYPDGLSFRERTMHGSPRLHSGLTLLELLTAVGVVGVLAAIALPAWSSARAAVHSSSARAAITSTLLDSERHALVSRTEAVVCPSTSGAGCTGGTDWSHGWIAFSDLDSNRKRSAHEPLIDREPALAGGVRLRSTQGRTRLVFQPGGSNAGSNVTMTLCDARGVRHAITLVLANSGRTRVGKPTAAAAAACVYG